MRLTLILLLLVANGVFAAWSQGLLAPWWPVPRPDGVQPERLQAELRPEALQLLSPKAAAERAALARAQEDVQPAVTVPVEPSPAAPAATAPRR